MISALTTAAFIFLLGGVFLLYLYLSGKWNG